MTKTNPAVDAVEAIDIFDFDVTQVLETESSKRPPRFDPKPAAGKTYTARVKLLVWPTNPKQSIIDKRQYYMEDAAGGFSYQSPASKGVNGWCAPSFQFWQLDPKRKHPHPLASKQRELSNQKHYYALIQIVKDVVNPANDGKVFVYRLPVKVFQLIEETMNPSDEARALGKTAKNMLSPVASFDLMLNVKTTTEGRNYDACSIAEAATPLMIEGKSAATMEKQEVINWLNEQFEAQQFADYLYREADENTKIRVKRILVEQFGFDRNEWREVEYVPSATYTAKPDAPAAPAAPVAAATANPTTAGTTAPDVAPAVDDTDELANLVNAALAD